MKVQRLLFALLSLTVATTTLADNLYLNNGSLIKGTIVSNNDNGIVIEAENGRTYSYSHTDIRKIEYSDEVVATAIPIEPQDHHYKQYTRYSRNNTGFWFAIEALGGSSINTTRKNGQFAEIDIYAGYRFNEFVRVGFGFGPRYYFNNEKLRCSSSEWTMPLIANVRGNLIPTAKRRVVPYYSFNIGTSVGDGLMVRPHLGIRVGEPRSAFNLSLFYMGQSLDYPEVTDGKSIKKSIFSSFLGLNLGYEF